MPKVEFKMIDADGVFQAPLVGLIKLARTIGLGQEMCLEMLDQCAKLMAADNVDEEKAKDIFSAGFRGYLEYSLIIAAMRKAKKDGTEARPPNAADDWVNEMISKIQKESKDAPSKES